MNLCVCGSGDVESNAHLFFECSEFSTVWMELLHWLGVESVLSNDKIVCSIGKWRIDNGAI